MSLEVNVGLLAMSPVVALLTIESDDLLLPNLQYSGGIFEIGDSFGKTGIETLFEVFHEDHLVVTTRTLVLLEVLDILLSGIGPHCNIQHLGVSCCSRVWITEPCSKLCDEVVEAHERRGRSIDVREIIVLFLLLNYYSLLMSSNGLNLLVMPFCSISSRTVGEGESDGFGP